MPYPLYLFANNFNNTYAMENALPQAKQAAKHVIGSNNSKDIAKIVLKNI